MWGTYKRKKRRKKRWDFTHLNGHEKFENNDELLGTMWEHTRKRKEKERGIVLIHLDMRD
jgi:hypothetical protein